MNDNTFVKIEDKNMPVDNFKYINLEEKVDNREGYVNLVFLLGIIATFVMWFMLMFFGK